MLLYSLLASLGFGALYAETAFARSASLTTATLFGALAFVAFLVSFLVPPRIFRYTNDDFAPRVMSQVISRAAVAAIVVLATNLGVWLTLGGSIHLLEELYIYSLVALFLFHGFGGAIASHVVYLQQTKQYNSNQLVAVLVLVTLILLILTLYFVAFDWAILRDDYVHLRDLTLVTLVFLSYGRALYLMAHH